MNPEANIIKAMCSDMENKFSSYFNWDDVDIEYVRIDIKKGKINILSNNYNWIVILCENDLELSFKERLVPGFKCWSDYSEFYKKRWVHYIEIK